MTEPISQNYVVQANELVRQTNWTMNKTPLKLFKALVASIDTARPPENNTITVKKADLVRFFDGGMSNYDYLKEQLQELITAVKVVDDEKRQVFVSLVSEIIWEKTTDKVSVVFSPKLMPYLIVSSHFLKYSAELLPQFRSKYGLILFEALYSRALQFGFESFIISVDELRWITGTTDSHPGFDRFYPQVIQTAIDDINKADTPIMVQADKLKHGRTVDQIRFKVRRRTSCTERTYEGVARPEWLNGSPNDPTRHQVEQLNIYDEWEIVEDL